VGTWISNWQSRYTTIQNWNRTWWNHHKKSPAT